MCSSRTEKGVSDFRHMCLCKCVQEQTMWHSHIGAMEGMQCVSPYGLGVNLQYAHGVAE
jgi:hypothetical protein